MTDDMGHPGVAVNETVDDAVLIERCRHGDREAFRGLFERYGDAVHSIAWHFSGDPAVAKDVTQQVFLKLFTVIGQYRGDSSFRTWLFRIVANACEDERRRRRRWLPFVDEALGSIGRVRQSQLSHSSRREVSDEVAAAIAGLSPKLRMPIVLRYLEELSYDEIAEALGISMGTVASRLNRGHRALADRLGHLRDSIGWDA